MRFIAILSILTLAAGLRAELAPAGAQTPNIVLILADDYGYGSSGCYGADPKLIRTPGIDRLAKEGIRLTSAHTPSSVCSPTRYAVLTGRYCWRTHLHDGAVLNTFDPLLIETNRPTISSMLKKHGYRTAVVGKWHLGYGTEKPVDFTGELKPGPLELGFDYQFAVPQNHNDMTRVYVENHKVYGLRSTQLTPESGKLGLDAPERDDPRVMGDLTDKALAWLNRQTAEHPFFLYFAPVAVHELVTPSEEMDGTSKAGPYGDFIHDLDLSVQRILEKLDEMGAAENTLVIFTSDNGGVTSERSRSGSQVVAIDKGLDINGEQWRGGKGGIWEGGSRVPLVARWPGHIPAGGTSDDLAGLVDLFATFADILNEPLPAPEECAPDSISMLPVLLGTGRPERTSLIVQSARGEFALLKGPWKLILPTSADRRKDTGPTEIELHNLEKDPEEERDVARRHPEIVKELSETLDRYRRQDYSRD